MPARQVNSTGAFLDQLSDPETNSQKLMDLSRPVAILSDNHDYPVGHSNWRCEVYELAFRDDTSTRHDASIARLLGSLATGRPISGASRLARPLLAPNVSLETGLAGADSLD